MKKASKKTRMKKTEAKKRNNTVSFRVDKNSWIRICEVFKNQKILLRANHIGKIVVQPDTAKDKTQQIESYGFVRIRPKRDFVVNS